MIDTKTLLREAEVLSAVQQPAGKATYVSDTLDNLAARIRELEAEAYKIAEQANRLNVRANAAEAERDRLRKALDRRAKKSDEYLEIANNRATKAERRAEAAESDLKQLGVINLTLWDQSLERRRSLERARRESNKARAVLAATEPETKDEMSALAEEIADHICSKDADPDRHALEFSLLLELLKALPLYGYAVVPDGYAVPLVEQEAKVAPLKCLTCYGRGWYRDIYNNARSPCPNGCKGSGEAG